MTFEEIDARRRRIGVSVPELCRRAKVSYSTYFRANGGKAPRASTLARWEKALDAGAPAPRPKADHGADTLTIFRGWANYFAPKLGVDPSIAISSDPALRANADPTWQLASRVRELAVYCTVTEREVSGASVARAIGVTRAAVSQMLRRVEWAREDPTIDAMLDAAVRLISGRPE